MTELSPEAQLDEALAAFEPRIVALAVASLARVRKLVPGSFELVYDAYSALSIPFATGEKLGDAFVSVVVYPKYVNVAFFRGTELEDREGLLEGTGRLMRHVTIEKESDLEKKGLAELIRVAAERAGWRRGLVGRLIVKKIYPRKRPRRPTPKVTKPGRRAPR
jgi:hypothetical protein